MLMRCCGHNLSGGGSLLDTAATLAADYYTGGAASVGSGLLNSGGSSSGAMMPSTNVNPAISTQISPSISPVFQQQFQPSNSAATAGTTSMPQFSSTQQPSAGGMPTTGNPYSGMASPALPSYPVAPSYPAPLPGGVTVPGISSGTMPSWTPLLILGAGLAAFIILSNKKGAE